MPSTSPERVVAESSPSSFARPKSPIFGVPSSASRTLLGFKSRWSKHEKKTSKFAGFELFFNESLDAASAQNSGNYQVLQITKKGKKSISKPVGFSVTYNAADDAVSLTLAGKPTFTSGGQLILTASGITDTAGDALIGNTVFTILPNAKGISG